VYLLYSSEARAPLATIPRTLFSHKDAWRASRCRSGGTDLDHQNRAVRHGCEQVGVGRKQQRGVSKIAQLKVRGNSSKSALACFMFSSSRDS